MIYIGIVLTLILMVLFHIDNNIVEIFRTYAEYLIAKEEKERRK